MNRSYIDIYCERTGPEFWSEPLNAVTNLAFIIAAFLLARTLMRADAESRRDYASWMFTGLIFVIGIGSGLFHTFATRWALFADVIPIAVFILLYTWYAMRRFAASPVSVCVAAVVAVLATAQAVPSLTGLRGGAYIAALAALIVIGGFLDIRRNHRAGRMLLAAAAIFAVSLTLRTVDGPVCAAIPVGTHFLWHLLNAAVLFIVTSALVNSAKRV